MSVYTYPSNFVAQSDQSYIVKRYLTFKDCVPQPPVDSCSLFNATRCGNDECYAQPFVNEVLYFQWRFSMPLSLSLAFSVTLVDADFNPIAYVVPTTTFGVGYDSELQTYQWLTIDTAAIPSNVDYFHVKVVYDTDNKEWYSEPFERVNCDEPTIVIEGQFDYNKDCYGNYHGALTNYAQATNNYITKTRVYGTIEKVGHSVTKELSEEVEISTTVEQLYLLRTSRKVPQYVADKIAEAFSGTRLFVDGVEYSTGSSIEKDNEEGKMWIVSSEIKQTCTKENFRCN